MKKFLLAGAAAALMMAMASPADAQWRGDGWGRGDARCRVVREWRHGVMRETRICRPASYGRWDRGWHRGRDRDWDRGDRSRFYDDRRDNWD
jgi:hypothetical protein